MPPIVYIIAGLIIVFVAGGSEALGLISGTAVFAIGVFLAITNDTGPG